MSEPQHAVEEPSNPEKRHRQNQLGLMLVIAGSALAVAVALVYNTRSNQLAVEVDQTEREKQRTEQQLDTTQGRLVGLVDRALAICQAGGPEANKLREVGLCEKAAEAKDDPQVQPSGPSFALVKEAVDAYFAANPVRHGRIPTPEELRPVIEEVFKANPPEDGRTPTADELLALIQQVYAAHPPRDGADGEDCDPAVKPECQGPQGPGIETVRFVRHGEDCYVEVVFEPFVDGRRRPMATQRVDPGFCYEPPPPPPPPSPSPEPSPSPSPGPPTPTS